MIEEWNKRDGFVGSDWTVEIILKMIWVVVDWASQGGLGVSKILLERFGKQITAFLGQNAKQLLEWLKGLAQIQIIELSSAFSQIVQIKRHVTEQWCIVVRVVPGPTWQVQKVVFEDEFQAVQVKAQNCVEFFCLSCGVDFEFCLVESRSQRLVLVHVKLFQLVQKLWLFQHFWCHCLSKFVVELHFLLKVFLSVFRLFVNETCLILWNLIAKSCQLFYVNFFVTHNVILCLNQESLECRDQLFNGPFSDVESHASGQEIVTNEKEQKHKVLDNFSDWVLKVYQLIFQFLILKVKVFPQNGKENHFKLNDFLLFRILDFNLVARVNVLFSDDANIFHWQS